MNYSAQYPLYIEPEEYRLDDWRQSNRQLALSYFAWYLEYYPLRVQILLEYFSESFTHNTKADLERIGRKVEQALLTDYFSYHEEEGQLVEFTNGSTYRMDARQQPNAQGISLALDMAAVLTQKLIELDLPSLRLELMTWGGKTNMDYHRPVFRKGKLQPFQPERISLAWALGILDGKFSGRIWADIYIDKKKNASE